MKLSKRKYTNSGSFESLKHSCLTLVFSALLAMYPGWLECASYISRKKERADQITLWQFKYRLGEDTTAFVVQLYGI